MGPPGASAARRGIHEPSARSACSRSAEDPAGGPAGRLFFIRAPRFFSSAAFASPTGGVLRPGSGSGTPRGLGGGAIGYPRLPRSTASAAASAPRMVHWPGFSPHARFIAAPRSWRPRQRRKSSPPSLVAYRNLPAALSVSWLPFITINSPPASRASFRRRSSMYSMAISSPPRSSWSPTCTATVDPPHHRPRSSTRPPARKASRALPRSPWRSPIATKRATAGRETGPGAPGERDACAAARRDAEGEEEDAAEPRPPERGGGGWTAAPPACRVSTNASTNGDHTGARVAHRGSVSSGRLRPAPIARRRARRARGAPREVPIAS